jgi:hypothetical protein
MKLPKAKKISQNTKAKIIWGITPKDMGVKCHKVNYWKRHNLLPGIIKSQHLKMNIYQAMCFRVVHKLTEFGVSSNLIFKLSETLWPVDQEKNSFVNDLNSLFGLKPRCMDFNYFPHSNTWAFTGKLFANAEDHDEIKEDEPRIVIPLATKFNELIAKELMETGKLNFIINDNLSEMLNIVYNKKPQYVDIIIDDTTKEFVCSYDSTRSIEDLLRHVSESIIPNGSILIMTKRNANHYQFQIR